VVLDNVREQALTAVMTSKKLTTAQVADRYAVSEDAVRRWIREKRLKAVNIAAGSRTMYRVSEASLDAFDQAHDAT
jgi:excisionase family DNA binding protein